MLRSYLAAAGLVLVACSDSSNTTSSSVFSGFAGVSWVVPDAEGHLVVGWKPAADADDYRVYVSRIQGRELKTLPVAHTGGSSVVVTPDALNQKYFVIVRAAKNGVEDGNTIEKSAVATPDKTAPMFAGATTATPAGNAGVALTWSAATDDFTPPDAITYDIFAGPTRAALAHVAASGPGDTTITLSQLGDPAQPFFFEVRARDLANNESADTPVLGSPLGQDATPPTFAGCNFAAFVDAKTAQVKWDLATDNHSAQSALSYAVFLGTKAGGEDFAAAPAIKVTNATSATLTALTAGTTYFVVCRAVDEAGNMDLNTVEKSFTTPTDAIPPTFAGIQDFTFDDTQRTVTLTWKPATDNQTPAALIVYDVFESTSTGAYDFRAPPRATSTAGASSIEVDKLASRSTLYWVVRARDQANNRDANNVEKSGTTLTSFSIDVQDVFNRNCAVVGCHVTGPATGNLNLAPGFAFDAIVSHPSAESALMRVATTGVAADSWLYHKITDQPPAVGLPMPAPETGNALSLIDTAIIQTWIEAKAPKN